MRYTSFTVVKIPYGKPRLLFERDISLRDKKLPIASLFHIGKNDSEIQRRRAVDENSVWKISFARRILYRKDIGEVKSFERTLQRQEAELRFFIVVSENVNAV